MASRVVLHVGAMKSGTSYLQALLFGQQERLAAHGVLVPGRVWPDQAKAVRQALSPAVSRPRPLWDRMVRQTGEHPGAAVISMEYLGPCAPSTAAGIVERLRTTPGTEVDVVLTARDLNRTLVSMWQETVQNGRSWTWADYLDDAGRLRPGEGRGHADRNTAGGTFWRQQHLLRMVLDWSDVVGRDRVTLVTVPVPGAPRTLLGERFAQATGLDLDLEAPVATANESLGLASILVLRRLNELLDEQGLAFPAASGTRKKILAKSVLAARRSQEPPLGLAVTDWVREQSATTVAALRATGVRLVGDLADLDPVAVDGVSPDDVPPADVSEAALAALAALVAVAAER